MSSILANVAEVKNIDGVFPGRGDRATLKSDLSTLPALSGNTPSISIIPDGVNAKNFGGIAEGKGAKPRLDLTCSNRHISTFEVVGNWRSRCAYQFLEVGAGEKAESFIHCGEEIGVLECRACGYKHKVTYNCKLRICPECARVKKSIIMDKYLPYVKSLYSGSLRLLTLTIRNVSDLGGGVKKIRESFTKLRRRKCYKGKFKGGLYGIEANPDDAGKWNVHLHCLCYGSFIPQGRLSEDWKTITGDSMVVDIRQAGNPEKALSYMLKYITKGVSPDEDKWTEKKLVEFVMALQDVRLVQAFGCFLGQIAKRKLFECPVCGMAIWKLTVGGEIVKDMLDDLLWVYHRDHAP